MNTYLYVAFDLVDEADPRWIEEGPLGFHQQMEDHFAGLARCVGGGTSFGGDHTNRDIDFQIEGNADDAVLFAEKVIAYGAELGWAATSYVIPNDDDSKRIEWTP